MSYATDRFIKNVRTALPGSLDNVILLEFFNVLDDFFKNTRIWTEDVTFPVVGGDPVGTIYYIEPESVSSIVNLIKVINPQGFVQPAAMELPGEVTLFQSPGQDDELTATVALTVTDPTQNNGYPEFPAWILDKHRTGFYDGVLARMMMQPSKPYTNEKLSVAHYKLFRNAMSLACTEAVHRNVQNAQAWAFPQTFATHNRRR